MASQPNVLMIVTDQQRTDTIHAWGNPLCRTPVLDRLAGEGTSFRRAYSPCPVCAPARGTISTGVVPHRAGSSDNCGHANVDLPDFATLLHEAGYQTHGYGKQYSRFGAKGAAGNRGGFDRWLDWNDYYAWWEQQGQHWCSEPRGPSSENYYIPHERGHDVTLSRSNWVTRHCEEFLAERDKDRPFLLCAHYGDPHPPWAVPYPWNFLFRPNEMPHPIRPANFRDYRCRANLFQNRYKWMEEAASGGDDLLLRRIRAAYHATVSYLDSLFGRILQALGDEIDNTLILFTCDHGEMLGDYGCVGKRCMLEGAVRVPLIARLPGFMPEGQDVRAAAGLADIMPTICAAAGVQCPDLPEARSLKDVASMAPGERIVYSQFSRKWNGQYFAADGERTYLYSAADQREWTFGVDDTLDQGPILEMDDRAQELKSSLLERHRNDWYSDAVDGDDWKQHDIPANPLHSDPDYGYLFAEKADKIQADVDALGAGYARKCTRVGHGHPMGEHMVPMTAEEHEKFDAPGSVYQPIEPAGQS